MLRVEAELNTVEDNISFKVSKPLASRQKPPSTNVGRG
jgi:hypothetical protein